MCMSDAIDLQKEFVAAPPALVSEGTVAVTRKYRTSMRDVQKALSPLMRQQVLAPITRLMQRSVGADGTIPAAAGPELKRQAGAIFMRLFVAQTVRQADGIAVFRDRDGRNYAPFDSNGRSAMAAFPQLLNEFYVRVTAQAVYAHRDWMARNLPEDIYRWLQSQAPTRRLERVEEAEDYRRKPGESFDDWRQRVVDGIGAYRANPLAEYESMHTWADPSGYVLSQRIWNNATQMRDELDKFLDFVIRNGYGALQMVEAAEFFLNPIYLGQMSNKPYGRNVNYPAMRLLRTEIAHASNEASFVAAMQNPHVDRIEVVRSRNGDRKCQICPQHATIGINGQRLRAAYLVIELLTRPPFHPNCMCHLRPFVEAMSEMNARLRAIMRDGLGLPPAVTPARPNLLIRAMLGAALFGLADQVFADLAS